jgi:hypothetical protein
MQKMGGEIQFINHSNPHLLQHGQQPEASFLLFIFALK